MKKSDLKKEIIAERGEDYYTKNKYLLDAQFEYIESLGDISDIKESVSCLYVCPPIERV